MCMYVCNGPHIIKTNSDSTLAPAPTPAPARQPSPSTTFISFSLRIKDARAALIAQENGRSKRNIKHRLQIRDRKNVTTTNMR